MLRKKEVKQILIIGMAGGLAQLTARQLSKNYPNTQIYGVDARETRHLPPIKNTTFITMNYSRGNFEKIFRNHNFDVVLHLGRISHISTNLYLNLSRRLNLNVTGTNVILELCLKFAVKKIVLLSTYFVYGAYPDNPVFIKEDAPLKASIKYPNLRDVVEMDQIATNWMWRNQKQMSTVVLRPCTIVGPKLKNAMTMYLTSPYAPIPMDFNPIFQFIHEFDMANVIANSIHRVPMGVYNVAIDDYISIRDAKKAVCADGLNVPIFIVEQLAKILKHLKRDVPDYLVDYIKYSCLVNNRSLKKYLGENFYKYTIKDTLNLLKPTKMEL